jgi:hypothetical protein
MAKSQPRALMGPDIASLYSFHEGRDSCQNPKRKAVTGTEVKTEQTHLTEGMKVHCTVHLNFVNYTTYVTRLINKKLV